MSRLTFLRKRRIGRLGNAWTPASFPNLLAHYDAATEPSVPLATVANSPVVTTMTDQQGPSGGVDGRGPVNFTQASAPARPLMVSGQSPSCLQAYVPDGAASFMTSPVGFSFAAGDSWSVFVTGNLGAVFTPEPFLYGAGGAVGMDFNLGGVAFKDAAGTHVLAAASGGWQRQLWLFDGVAGTITLNRNGVQVGQFSPWTPSAFVPAVLWRNGTAGAAFGVSRLGEWGVYKGLLDTNAQALLDRQQQLKWFTLCI